MNKKIIKKLFNSQSLSINKFAKKANMNVAVLHNILTNPKSNTTEKNIVKLAKGFNVKISVLFGE